MPTQTSSLTNGGYFAEDPVNKTFIKPPHAGSHDAGDVQCAETKRLAIDEFNALNRRIAHIWTPEMDEEIERMSRQDRLTRCAKLTEEKVMRAQRRAQLTRDLKKAVAVKLRDDALGVDAELARIRAALTGLELHKLNDTARTARYPCRTVPSLIRHMNMKKTSPKQERSTSKRSRTPSVSSNRRSRSRSVIASVPSRLLRRTKKSEASMRRVFRRV